MKKFSKTVGQDIPKEPKIESKYTDSDIMKIEMMQLIDKYLSIQSYGSVDNRFLSGSVKIKGKELLAEAIVDIFDKKRKGDKISILESLKGKISDWESLDGEIKTLEADDVSIENKIKFNSMLERYSDVDSLFLYIESKMDKMSPKTKNDYILLLKNSKLDSGIKDINI